jgi:hypothetical protein
LKACIISVTTSIVAGTAYTVDQICILGTDALLSI